MNFSPSTSKMPKTSPLLTALSLLLSLGALLTLVSAQGNENCYINDSGFTCCSKSLGQSFYFPSPF